MSRELIIQSSLKMFMKYGIKSISMDDISKELGMSKKTLYNFINNKDELVMAVVKSFTDSEKVIIGEFQKSASNAIEEMANIGRYVLQHMREIKPALKFDLKKYYPKVWKEISKIHFPFIEKTIQENINRGKSEGYYLADTNELIISKIYVAIGQSLVDPDIFPLAQYNPGDIYHSYFFYHMNGIMNEVGKNELKKQTNLEKS